MPLINIVEAVNQAMAYALEHDNSVMLLGEDIGKNGGVFRATDGLQSRFGENRVRDTPLAESMLAGTAIGMAAQGLKPVVEFQFMGFIYPGLDHILNHASRLRNRTRGRLSCPVVYRAPYGGGIRATQPSPAGRPGSAASTQPAAECLDFQLCFQVLSSGFRFEVSDFRF